MPITSYDEPTEYNAKQKKTVGDEGDGPCL